MHVCAAFTSGCTICVPFASTTFLWTIATMLSEKLDRTTYRKNVVKNSITPMISRFGILRLTIMFKYRQINNNKL